MPLPFGFDHVPYLSGDTQNWICPSVLMESEISLCTVEVRYIPQSFWFYFASPWIRRYRRIAAAGDSRALRVQVGSLIAPKLEEAFSVLRCPPFLVCCWWSCLRLYAVSIHFAFLNYQPSLLSSHILVPPFLKCYQPSLFRPSIVWPLFLFLSLISSLSVRYSQGTFF